MAPVQHSPEEMRRRLNDPSDVQAQDVRSAIGNIPKVFTCDDWTKARAFEDTLLMAIQLALQPQGSLGTEVARATALAFLKLAHQSVEHPIVPKDKELPS